MRDIEKYGELYKNNPFENYKVIYRRKECIKQLSKFNHDNVIEVGCGLDSIFNYIDVKKGWIIEPNRFFVQKAQADLKNKDIEIIEGYIENINVNNSLNLDFMIIDSLLHEVENPDILLNAVYDIVDENTVIHISVPNAKSFHRLLGQEIKMIKDVHDLSDMAKDMQQQRVYDFDSLKKDIEKNGYKIIDHGFMFIKPFSHNQMQLCLDNKIINDNVIEGLNNMIKYIPELGSEIWIDIKKSI